MAEQKLIFGCGYLGQRVAQRWREAGHEVHVVTRNELRAEQFAQHGYHPHLADVTRRDTLINLPPAESILYAVGHDRTAGLSIEEVYAGGLSNVLDALAETFMATPLSTTGGGGAPRSGSPRDLRIIYVSTTGVYGDAEGDWIDEQSPTTARRPGGRASLAAEEVLRGHALAEHGIVLRMAGLYGPGRIPNRQAIIEGRPIEVPSEGWLNLIHIDDAAAIVEAVDRHITPPRLYTVSDGQPTPRRAYYEHLARLLGAPAPQFAEPSPEAAATQRAAASKRISNRRLMSEVPIILKYPSYREGLAAIVAE